MPFPYSYLQMEYYIVGNRQQYRQVTNRGQLVVGFNHSYPYSKYPTVLLPIYQRYPSIPTRLIVLLLPQGWWSCGTPRVQQVQEVIVGIPVCIIQIPRPLVPVYPYTCTENPHLPLYTRGSTLGQVGGSQQVIECIVGYSQYGRL